MTLVVVWAVALVCFGLALAGLITDKKWLLVRLYAIIAFCGFAYAGFVLTRAGWITWYEHYGTAKGLYAVIGLTKGYIGIVLGTGVLVAAFLKRG